MHPVRVGRLGCAVVAALLLAGAASGEPRDEDRPPAAAGLGQTEPAAVKADAKPAEAQSTTAPAAPRTQRLEEVLVTALRGEATWFDTPDTVEAVRASDIRQRKMSPTLPEALSEMPGAMLQKTASGQGSPYLRGFTGFRNLLLIDGVRLNNSTFRDGPNQYWNTIDQLAVERLEVVKGPASVLYGSDAIGGTVNVITNSPQTGDTAGGWERRIYYRYSTAENSQTVRGEVSGRLDPRLALLMGSSYKHFGDVCAGDDVRTQPKTRYQDWDGDIKLVYDPQPNQRWVFAHQHVDQDDIWRTHKTVYGIAWEGTTVGDELKRVLDQNRDLTYLQYHAEKLDGPVDTIHANLSYQRQSERQSRMRSDGRFDRQGFDVDTLGVWLQLESPSPVGRWTYGLENYYDWVDSFLKEYNADGTPRPARVQGPVADDAGYEQFGFFVQDDIPLGERANLILGGRYTTVRADADRVENLVTKQRIAVKNNWKSLVGSARAVCRLDRQEHWAAFGGVSQGFRAPNLSDLTRLDTARTKEIETPSPDLQPEKFIQYEIGLKTDYEAFRGQASFFITDIDQMIVRSPTGAVIGGNNEVTKKNAGNGWLHGVELEAWWRLTRDWSAFGGFTYIDGEADAYPTSAPVERQEPIDRLMPPTGYAGLRWDSPGRRVWIEGVGTFAARAHQLSTADKGDTQRIPPDGTPGYTVLTLRGGWKVNDNLMAFAALENLTDEDYRIHGSGVNEPGINLVVGLEMEF